MACQDDLFSDEDARVARAAADVDDGAAGFTASVLSCSATLLLVQEDPSSHLMVVSVPVGRR